MAIDAVAGLATDRIARAVFNSSEVSAECLRWTRWLPRAAFSCALAMSDAGLGDACPDECAAALAFAGQAMS